MGRGERPQRAVDVNGQAAMFRPTEFPIAVDKTTALTAVALIRELVAADWGGRIRFLQAEPVLLNQGVADVLRDSEPLLSAVIDIAAEQGIDVFEEASVHLTALASLDEVQCGDDMVLPHLKRAYEFMTHGEAAWFAPVVVVALETNDSLIAVGDELRLNIGGYYMAALSIASGLQPTDVKDAYRLACADWTEVWDELETRTDWVLIAEAAKVVAAVERRFGLESDAPCWADELRELCLTAGQLGMAVARQSHRIVVLLNDASRPKRRWNRKSKRQLAQMAAWAVEWFQDSGVDWVLLPAVTALRRLEQLTPAKHRSRANVLGVLGVLISESVRAGVLPPEVLKEAVRYEREALSLTPRSHPAHPEAASNLGGRLLEAFQCGFHDEASVAEAIALVRDAVQLVPEDDPVKPLAYANLGILWSESIQAGVFDKTDFKEALGYLSRAVASTSTQDPNRARLAWNMGAQLCVGVELGVLTPSQLSKAVRYGEEGLELTSDSHPDRAMAASSVASALALAVEFGVCKTQDLRDAVTYDREALALTPFDHADRPRYSSNLSVQLSQAVQAGVLPPAVLEEAVACARQAASLTPMNHPLRSMVTQNLFHVTAEAVEAGLMPKAVLEEVALLTQAHRLWGAVDDVAGIEVADSSAMNAAIDQARVDLEASPFENFARADALQTHASLLAQAVASRTIEPSNLQTAISDARAALELTPREHHRWAGRASNLGIHIGAAVQLSEACATLLLEALEYEREALVRTSQQHPKLAGRAANLANRLYQAVESGVLSADEVKDDLTMVMDSLWEAIRRSATTNASRRARVAGIQSAVAYLPQLAVETGDPLLTIEAVEAVRNHLIGSTIPDNVPSNVEESLAATYRIRRQELTDAQFLYRSGAGTMPQCRAALDQLNTTIDRIQRTAGGFATRPSSVELLKLVPDKALVIYLVVGNRSGAAVVCERGKAPLVVPLPGLTDEETLVQAKKLHESLLDAPDVGRWLWSVVVEPLQAASALDSRDLIVIPTGPVSMIPFHIATNAQGRSVDQVHSTRLLPSMTLLDPVVADALRPAPVTIIGDAPELIYLQADLATAKAHFGTHQALVGSEATRDAVLHALEGASEATIGAHASYMAKGGAALHLADGQLKADEILRMTRYERGLAVLCGCEMGAPDLNIVDENFGLPNALLRAGFRGVVATNWKVNDLVAFVTITRLREQQSLQPNRPVHRLMVDIRLWLKSLTREQLRIWLMEAATTEKLPQWPSTESQ